jgi:hypothetical protein
VSLRPCFRTKKKKIEGEKIKAGERKTKMNKLIYKIPGILG